MEILPTLPDSKGKEENMDQFAKTVDIETCMKKEAKNGLNSEIEY